MPKNKETAVINSFPLSHEQCGVLKQCLEHFASDTQPNIMVVEAGAGTGKTRIINELKLLLPNLIVSASTNSASLLINGSTVHKALHYPFDASEGSRLPQKVISKGIMVIDEYSLLNKSILSDLTKSDKRVVLFGDKGQTTVQGVPCTSTFKKAYLTHNFRTSKKAILKIVKDSKHFTLQKLTDYEEKGVIEVFTDHKKFIEALLESKEKTLVASYFNSHLPKYTKVMSQNSVQGLPENYLITTIHKAQGQSFHTVGIDCASVIYAHNKEVTKYSPLKLTLEEVYTLFYVSFSRATNRLLLYKGKKRNFT